MLLYNVPQFAHPNVSGWAVAALAGHPNIAGMKDSNGNIGQLAAFRPLAPPDWNLIVGTAAAWFPAQALGAQAAILALANCLPAEYARVQAAFEAGDLARGPGDLPPPAAREHGPDHHLRDRRPEARPSTCSGTREEACALPCCR